MVRASKLPFRNFEYNIRRAQALARLDGYLEDILYKEGKGTVGVFVNITKEFTQFLGIDAVMKKVEETMKAQLKLEYEQKGKEYYEKIGKDMVKRLKPRIKKIAEMFQDLELVMDQTLTEQALIVAVSAFEVYLREIIVSIVTLNPSVRKKFHQEIKDAISLSKLEGFKEDAKRTQGEIVADQVRLDTGRIKSLLRRLVGLENIFGDHETELKVRKVFECRHIVIHRAGLVDPKFKKATSFKGAIDTQVKISRRYVLESIGLLKRLVDRIEKSVHKKT
jgi:hypothetical protein